MTIEASRSVASIVSGDKLEICVHSDGSGDDKEHGEVFVFFADSQKSPKKQAAFSGLPV